MASCAGQHNLPSAVCLLFLDFCHECCHAGDAASTHNKHDLVSGKSLFHLQNFNMHNARELQLQGLQQLWYRFT